MSLPFDLSVFVFAACVMVFAYTIFGISAFGSSLFSVPLLTYFLPFDVVLPICVLLDLAVALALGSRLSNEADRSELAVMVPFCLIGAILGVTLLVNLPRRAISGAFGAFEAAFGVYLLMQPHARRAVSRAWAPVAGLAGGISGSLFGVGGPPYAIYLSQRMPGGRGFRATLAGMVLFSVTIRAFVFTTSGLMVRDRLVAFVLLLPFAVLGLWLGNRLHARMKQADVARVVSLLVLLTGLSVMVRALTGS